MTALPLESKLIASKHNSIWIFVVVIATLIAYIPALRGGWIWDDNHYVTDNIHLRTLHGLRELWLRPGAVPQYYPLTHTTFWIEYHLWQLHPFGYHLDNVLLHIGCALMIALILRRLGVRGFVLAAAIFALHPVHVESVAWVTERKNVLSGFLYLLALWLALDVWEISPPTQRFPRQGGYWICLTLFIGALLSKSVTASLPAVILLLVWWKRRRIRSRDVFLLLPFFACGLAMGAVTSWMEKHVVGAVGPDWNWTFAQRILIAGRAIWFYLGKLIWPRPLIFAYPKWDIDSASLMQWAYPAAALVFLLWTWKRRKCGLFVAAAFFVISLVPALGFVDVYPMRYSFVADHFQYLASIGPIAVAGAILSRTRWPVVAPVFIALAVLTWRQGGVYRDSESLWRDVVSRDQQSVIGHCDLGMELLSRGKADQAAEQLRRAAEIDPKFIEARVGLGLVAEAKGNRSSAMEIYRRANKTVSGNPLPLWHMGMLSRLQGDLGEAKDQFIAAGERLPNPAPAYEQLGEIALTQNDLAAARGDFMAALSADPDRVDSHNNLANVYLTQDDFAGAQRECEAALAIDPRNAEVLNNLGVALARQGRMEEAAAAFAKALRIDASFKMAAENLAKLRR